MTVSPDGLRAPAASPAAAAVHFVAPDYANWSVHEVHDPYTPSGRSLIFVSPAGFRRVREYPPHWSTLDAAELWSLSWSR